MGRTNGAGVKLDPNVRKKWAKNLRNLRGTDRQEDFAARLGIDQATLSRIERGGCLTDDMKWLICGRLNMTVDEVFPWPFTPPALHDDPEPEPKPAKRRTRKKAA